MTNFFPNTLCSLPTIHTFQFAGHSKAEIKRRIFIGNRTARARWLRLCMAETCRKCFSICIFLHAGIVMVMSLKQLWNKHKTFQSCFSVLFQSRLTCVGVWNKTEQICKVMFSDLSVSLSVCLSARLLKKFWADFDLGPLQKFHQCPPSRLRFVLVTGVQFIRLQTQLF